jgi:drug/metabolite transporter (DMT)-like permease
MSSGNLFIDMPGFSATMERSRMETSAFLFAVATFVLWGTTNFLIGYGEKSLKMDPQVFTAVMWCAMGALGLVMLVYVILTGREIPMNINISVPAAAGLLLGVGILAFTFAMSHTDMSTGATAAVATSNAALTVMLAFFLLREPLLLKEWIGIATVILGIIILRI